MNTSEKHAVVLGGSLAGLLAARVLADHFERVTLIERATIRHSSIREFYLACWSTDCTDP